MEHERSEYYCPHCGAILDDQIGFDPDLGAWECTECGQMLFGDEVEDTQVYFNDIVWHCDNCDAVLNIQPGFVDFLGYWTCTECGHENEISEENIIESPPLPASKTLRRIVRFTHFLERVSEKLIQDKTDSDSHDESDDSETDSSYPHDDPDGEVSSNTEPEVIEQHFTMQPPIGTVVRPSMGKQILYHVIRKKLETKQSSDKLKGMTIRAAYVELATWGFYNIETIAEEDLEITDIGRDGIVSNIIINGYSFFEANSFFPFNATAIIQYHSLKTIQPPLTSKQAKGRNYQDILAVFTHAGFCNVKVHSIHDLTLGWITKDGAIENIQIAGKNSFSLQEKYRPDVSVIISYHTFKQKRSQL